MKGEINDDKQDGMKKMLLDVIRLWERKLLNNECTPSDIRKCAELVAGNLDLLVSAKELSEIYGKPLSSVKACISRNNLARENPPKVRKFYSLAAFKNVMPKSWRKG